MYGKNLKTLILYMDHLPDEVQIVHFEQSQLFGVVEQLLQEHKYFAELLLLVFQDWQIHLK